MDGAGESVRSGYYGMAASFLECDEALYTVLHEIAGMRLFNHMVATRQIATYIINECNRLDYTLSPQKKNIRNLQNV